MLYSPSQFQRDQLLADLLAVRARLAAGWRKGGWGQQGRYCLVGTVQAELGQPVGYTAHIRPDQPAELRVGRALAAIYTTLYGPHAPVNIPMRQVVSKIISFNDTAATKDAVLLLLDRAIAAVQEQAGATVRAAA